MEPTQIYLKGSLWRRLFAFIIDIVISTFIPSIFFSLLYFVGIKIFPFDQIFIGLIAIFYWPLMTYKYGATLGKKWLRLKVVDSHSYEHISIGKALIREWLGKLLSSLVFSLGFIWTLIDRKDQAWHDKIAGTYVLAVDAQGDPIPTQEEIIISKRRKVLFWVILLADFIQFLILPIFMLSYLFIARPVQIRGDAMTPNYRNGQYWLTNPGAYRTTDPQRGDVVILNSPRTPNIQLIERVIAIPGDQIEIKDGDIFLNNLLLKEPYLNGDMKTNVWVNGFIQEGQSIPLPANQYFVMGDNRPKSSDSRDFGLVLKDKIVGKVSTCYWRCSE